LPIGLLTGLFATIAGNDGSATTRSVVRLTLGLATAEALLHVADWLSGLHIPADPSLRDVARNSARNFLFDGTTVALGVLAAAVVPAMVLTRWAGQSRSAAIAVAIASFGAASWLTTRSPVVHAEASLTAPPDKPALARDYNVILISIDSLRSDHLGSYGYSRATSPTIDRLAADGVVFRHNSSTTAWTLPGHLSMLTGRSLLGHGVVSDDRMLTADVPTLAESFRAGGYTTGGIVSAPYVEARYGFARGFDNYDFRLIGFTTNGFC
jgi:hypothetical protein